MKILVSDLARIATRATAEGIVDLDVQPNKLVGQATSGTTVITFIIEPVLKSDGTPGLRVSKTTTTKNTILNEGT